MQEPHTPVLTLCLISYCLALALLLSLLHAPSSEQSTQSMQGHLILLAKVTGSGGKIGFISGYLNWWWLSSGQD